MIVSAGMAESGSGQLNIIVCSDWLPALARWIQIIWINKKWSPKKWLLQWSESSMFRSGVVNCRCMKMSLVMSMRFIFGNNWNDVPSSSHFLDFCVFTHAFWSIQKQIVKYDIKSKYPEEFSTIDKVGIGKCLARKSYFILNISPPRLRAVSYFLFLSQ